MEELTCCAGTVHSVIFQNAENGYTVLRLETDSGESITVTGCLPFSAPGEQIEAGGSWVRHPSHGQQFKAETAERKMPSDRKAIYEYLAFGAVKGIGPATAAAIVTMFGEDTLEIIDSLKKVRLVLPEDVEQETFLFEFKGPGVVKSRMRNPYRRQTYPTVLSSP